MIGRIIEIAGESRYLHKDRGFLMICHEDVKQSRIPLDDISALICSAYGDDQQIFPTLKRISNDVAFGDVRSPC